MLFFPISKVGFSVAILQLRVTLAPLLVSAERKLVKKCTMTTKPGFIAVTFCTTKVKLRKEAKRSVNIFLGPDL